MSLSTPISKRPTTPKHHLIKERSRPQYQAWTETLETTPSFPNRSITPSFILNNLSISRFGIFCWSRIVSACEIVNASRYCLPTKSPRPRASSSSCAAFPILVRAVTASKAGFEAVGKTVCMEPWLTVLELEWVGKGFTGPMWRREAAKSGSRPSRSIARWSVSERYFEGERGSSTIFPLRFLSVLARKPMSTYHLTWC